MDDSKNKNYDEEEVIEGMFRAKIRLLDAIIERYKTDIVLRKKERDLYMMNFGRYHIRHSKLKLIYDKYRDTRFYLIEDITDGEVIDMDTIDSFLKEELLERVDTIRKEESFVRTSRIRCLFENIFMEHNIRRLRLVWDIANKMSPEVYPMQVEERTSLYNEAISAFENENVNYLKMVHDMSCQIPVPKFVGSIEEIREEKMRLEERTREVRAQIYLMKREFPFTYSKILADDAKIDEEIERLKQVNRDLQKEIRKIKSEIDEITDYYLNDFFRDEE